MNHQAPNIQTKVVETRIKCDEHGCDWSKEINWEEVPDWHNKPCPSCGNGVIVNDADFDVWKMLKTLTTLNMPQLPTTGPGLLVEATIDTSGLRNTKEVKDGV